MMIMSKNAIVPKYPHDSKRDIIIQQVKKQNVHFKHSTVCIYSIFLTKTKAELQHMSVFHEQFCGFERIISDSVIHSQPLASLLNKWLDDSLIKTVPPTGGFSLIFKSFT